MHRSKFGCQAARLLVRAIKQNNARSKVSYLLGKKPSGLGFGLVFFWIAPSLGLLSLTDHGPLALTFISSDKLC